LVSSSRSLSVISLATSCFTLMRAMWKSPSCHTTQHSTAQHSMQYVGGQWLLWIC
jgi:hypothetical protein